MDSPWIFFLSSRHYFGVQSVHVCPRHTDARMYAPPSLGPRIHITTWGPENGPVLNPFPYSSNQPNGPHKAPHQVSHGTSFVMYSALDLLGKDHQAVCHHLGLICTIVGYVIPNHADMWE